MGEPLYRSRPLDLPPASMAEALRINDFVYASHGSSNTFMVRTSEGRVIINTSSVSGLMAAPGQSAYGASRAANCQLSRTMAVEYGPHNIRVNCICPGAILTNPPKPEEIDATTLEIIAEGTPLGRFGKPEEVARVALFLARDDSSYVTGFTLPVDGGLVESPFLDQRL